MDIAALKLILTRDEGVRLKPYKDSVGKLTIGIGRNLDDVGITAVEADFLLTNDIQKVQAALNEKLPWWAGLSNNRQIVLASMAFNLGVGGLLAFKQMLTECRAGNYAAAAAQMLDSKWSKQVGDRPHRLARMMEEG